MTPFRLLDLPDDTLGKLLERFNVSELFGLSQCSQRMRNLVRKRALSYQLQLQGYIRIAPSSSVHLVNRNEMRGWRRYTSIAPYMTSWEFYGKRFLRRFKRRNTAVYKINGQDVELTRKHHFGQFICPLVLQLPEILQFAENLYDVFNARFCSMSITFATGVLETIRRFEMIRAVPKVQILGLVSHSEMREILRDFDNRECLSLGCFPGNDFVCNHTIRAQELRVPRSTWVTRSDLLNMQCNRIDLLESILTNKDLNAFLHKWMNGQDTEFEYLSVQCAWLDLPSDECEDNFHGLINDYMEIDNDEEHVAGPDGIPNGNPVADPAVNPVANPVADPAADPAVNPVADPAVNPVANPVADPAADPAVNPVADPAADPAANPVVNPVANPVADPAADPVANPVVNPAVNPVADPAVNPVVNPVVHPDLDNDSNDDRMDVDDEDDEYFDLDKVTAGLPTIRGSRKRLNATRFREKLSMGEIQYERGVDLKRPSDGMLGTVVIHGRYGGRTTDSFLFVAWHDPHPYAL